MDRGFDRVDADIRDLRAEMDTRFHLLERSVQRSGAGLILTFVAGFVTLLLAGS
jgi:hypothetical protein